MKARRSPLFVQVAEILRSEISKLDAGTKLETDQGMARRFSVSVSVVREALSILGRDGLVTRRVGRGTCVAKKAFPPTRPIAILCDIDPTRLLSPLYMLERIQWAKQLLEEKGFETAIYFGDDTSTHHAPLKLTCRQFIKDLTAKRLGGVLAVWAMPTQEWMDLVREQALPHVGFGLLHERAVSFDFETYLRYALRLLQARGRSRIAYISGVSEWNLDGHDSDRNKRVVKIFEEEGVRVREGWFSHEWHRSVEGAGWSAFREVWTRHPDRPDGIVLGNFAFYEGVKAAVNSLHIRTPDEIEFVVPRSRTAVSRINDEAVIPIYYNSQPMIGEAVEMLSALFSQVEVQPECRFVDVWELPVEVQKTVIAP